MPLEEQADDGSNVQRLPDRRALSITDELNELLAMLKGACPAGAIIGFDFDGRLRVHIDVHDLEDLLKVEGVLTTLGGGGVFHGLARADTPHHPFSNRLTAIVDR